MSKHDDIAALVGSASGSGKEGYSHYVRLGGTRNFNGWEVARRRLAEDPDDRVSIPTTKAMVVPTGDYKGLTMGFFDIETTFSNEPVVLYAAIMDSFGRLSQFPCGPDWTDDRELVRAYVDALNEYDILLSWNGILFDIPVLNARLAFWGAQDGKGPRRVNPNMHIDLMYYATGRFNRLGRKSLQNVSEYFAVGSEKTPLRIRTWNGAMQGKPEDYAKIVEHCDRDVQVLRDVFPVLKQHIRNIHRGG
jgi:uncharacterized protein YprB with RNaseH-like and TPR domain